jgi:hypothetical protein
MSKIKVNSIEAATGSTITIPSGQTLDISSTTLTLPSTVVTTTGTQTLTNKTIGVSQLSGTLPVANGGTGLTTLGSASQVLRVNSGATALEFGTVVSGIVQVKSARQTSTESFTTENVMLGPTATITPTSASNKILVMVQGMTSFSSTTVTGTMGLRYATGTSVANTDTLVGGGDAASSRSRGIAWSGQVSEAWQGVNISYHILHAPATTSQISYRLCHLGNDSGATGYLGRTGRDTDDDNHPRVDTNITLIEISSAIL